MSGQLVDGEAACKKKEKKKEKSHVGHFHHGGISSCSSTVTCGRV